MKTPRDVDEYIGYAPKEYQGTLKELRSLILELVPAVQESICYGMPAYKWAEKPLFYFAAMKGHLGLYPTSGPIVALKHMLADFSTSKGCVRVPWSASLPKTVIKKLLQERQREIRALK